MKFFIDTANIEEIRKANDMGVIAGVTTNPSLIAKEGRDYAPSIATVHEGMIWPNGISVKFLWFGVTLILSLIHI